ncbi:MAG: 2-phospho-L-lactate guanylyltransferase [Dermatophilaceae bacterium]
MERIMVRRRADVERAAAGWQDRRVVVIPVDPPGADRSAWAVVVPIKGGPLAKSRLELPRPLRTELADAFALDTLAAAAAGMPHAHLLVVGPPPDPGSVTEARTVVADPGRGLDAAVAAGVEAAAALGAARVAVLLADHPALRPAELTAAVAACSAYQRAVVADADGTGTALLTLPAASPVATAFGVGSAAAHARLGFVPVQVDAPGLRLDVDDTPALRRAVGLGVGPYTDRTLRRASLPGVQATMAQVHDDGSSTALLDDGTTVTVPAGVAAASGLRHLRTGQRVSIELDESGVVATRVWIVGIGPGETIR